MKILFAGSLGPGQTSGMRMDALRRLGHEVAGYDTEVCWSRMGPVSRKLQQGLGRGAAVSIINQGVLNLAQQFKPDLLWAEKQRFLRSDTLYDLRKRGIRLLHFTPDPYFSLGWKRTKIMDSALSTFDYLVTAKRYELSEYESVGPQVIYMPLGFCDKVHRPASPALHAENSIYAADISFLGGWEPRREQLLSGIVHNVACQLKIWGYGWDHLADGKITFRRWQGMRINAGDQPYKVVKDPQLAASVKGSEVYGEKYAWGLSSGRISVGFLRKICPDQHTTRSFEIPACGSMLLADRSEEHQDFFAEGREAEFFSSQEELLDKSRYYVAHENQRYAIATRGFQRCHASGYSYKDRLHEALKQVA